MEHERKRDEQILEENMSNTGITYMTKNLK